MSTESEIACATCDGFRWLCPNPDGHLKPCNASTLMPHDGQVPCPSCVPPTTESE